jgi:hypothetical protein
VRLYRDEAVVLRSMDFMEADRIVTLLTREHGRQHDAVVVGVRLGAEHRDLVEAGRDLEQFFQRAHAGHAVAHHHQPGFLHRASGSARKNKKGVPMRRGDRPARMVTPLSWAAARRCTRPCGHS